jgi:hypothetical protein
MKTRMSNFGLVLPFEIEIIHALRTSNMGRCEWHFHNHFARKRIKGEWFNLTDEDVTFFCKAGTDYDVRLKFCVDPTPNLSDYK